MVFEDRVRLQAAVTLSSAWLVILERQLNVLAGHPTEDCKEADVIVRRFAALFSSPRRRVARPLSREGNVELVHAGRVLEKLRRDIVARNL